MYKLFTDGGARGNPGHSATGAFLYDIENNLVASDGKYIGIATNNVAEYSALILGLNTAIANGVKELNCNLDSELVVKQLRGEYKVKDAKMQELFAQVKELLKQFDKVMFTHVPRAQNKEADKKVNEILDARI